MSVRIWLARFPDLLSRLGVVVALNFTSGLLMILQAVLLAGIVTDVFLGGKGLTSESHLVAWLLVVLSVRALTFALAEKASSSVSVRLRSDLRMRLVRHLFDLGPVFLRTERSGELLNTALTGVEQMDVYVAKYLPQAAQAFAIPVAVWCVVVGADIWTALILAITAPLIPIFMILIGKGAEAATTRQWRTLSLLGGHFLDVIRGLTTLKIFNRSKAQVEIIRHMTDEYRSTTMISLRIAFLSALVLELLTTLSTAVVAVMLGLRLLNGHIDFHRAFLILLLAPEFYQPIRMIGTQFHASMNGVESAKRIFSILDMKPSSRASSEKPVEYITMTSTPCDIEFEDVSFTYPGASSSTLSHVNFRVQRGELVAIVGPSGAGKSAIFDLLLQFAAPAGGRILINGIDLQQFQADEWRQRVAYVPQRVHMFPGTIADNIALSQPGASLSDVQYAAKSAFADEFIRELPQGYETMVSEQLELSGGQAQRIAMARALFKRAPVLCLDEPTSQLDVASEQALQSGLAGRLRDQTTLVVSHRMQTTMKAHRIVVLDAGRVTEVGQHAELLAGEGVYARLWRTHDTRVNES